MPNLPVVKALLVCDTVIHEQDTNKKSCIGIFHRVNASVFPCQHGQLSIYANITDAEGKYVFRLLLVNLKDGKVIGNGSTPPLEIANRLQTSELALKLQNIVFPEAGKYEFRLLANEELIAQKEVEARRVPRA